MKDWFDKWIDFLIRRYWLFLLLGIVVVGWSTPKTIKLYKNISTDLISLLPDHYPAVQEVHKIRDKFEDGTHLAITLEGKDSRQIESWLKSLAQYLEKNSSLVDHVDTKKGGYDFFYNHKLLFVDLEDLQVGKERLDREIQKKKLGGLFVELGQPEDEEFYYADLELKYREKAEDGASSPFFRNKNKTLYTMYVYAKGTDTSLGYNKKFFEQVNQYTQQWQADLKENKPIALYFMGKAKSRVDEYNTLIHDLKIAGIVSTSAILLLLIVYFKSIIAPILIFIPLLIGLVGAFGVSSFFVDKLNIITAFLYSILSGLGVENGIHFVSRYNFDRSHGSKMEEALKDVMFKTGRSIGFSVAAVAAIFLSLIINDFRGFSQFGLIAGIGLLCVYLSYLLFFAPTVILFEKLKCLSKWRAPLFSKTELKKSLPVTFLLWGGVLLTLFSLGVGLTQEIFEYDFSRLKARIPESIVAKAKNRETVDKLVGPGTVLIHGNQEAKILKEVIRKKLKEDKDSPTIESFISYFDLVPEDQKEKLSTLKEIEKILQDKTLKLVPKEKLKDLDRFKDALRETTPIEPGEVPEVVIKAFRGAKGEGEFAYIQPKREMSLDDGRNAMRFLEDVGEIKTPTKTFYTVSDPLIFAKVLKTMMQDAPKAIGLAILIILVLLWLDQRRLKKVWVMVLPILLGEIWLLGFLFLFGWKLDFYSMVIVPTIMGMSIDNCIHIYHRYEEAGKGSIVKVISTAGLTCAVASTTNALGFLGLVFANHGGLASLGRVAILGLVTTLLSTVVFFPAMLAYLEKKKVNEA
ncbi:MAG: hypothetical protein A3F82_04555 [Deltaproteobacteria bacterium RIFCSPLOWO2_12_FULL_44_12]|nr:MAG: hypothetical protein A2712_07900 [Deltaproteobacteria bacterium RIFCSPHIGHO2_01_FULL_43_49]OGQ14737.1 MAG: hypothetical protein A3D22_09095 [Deltaproteobacteria bacterium RIFCSPHIGHO2_02_FULL_44_53]OGQ28123.1 MAG: hypothetical protein A3D98_07805 [Deltaproteobacteria bacterium RIFCSPHIGHO2_12_FULL_44_21]OGQ31335.1 MAG: hypothetical protein A2979_07855 [Deltaproteobacteria bacterium RIFCSPLOWO2_01_FULL_45_74]OGQ43327.1 MAG: hypothetical protein A3I70_01515 [Deltaproteobacteria bacterium 